MMLRMNTMTIPQDLSKYKEQPISPAGIMIVPHQTHLSSSRSRISLNTHMFNFLLEGEKILHYSGRTLRITSDNIMLLSGNNCLMSEKLSTNGRYKCILFFFEETVLNNFFRKHPPLALHQEAEEQESREPVICFTKDEFIRNYIQSLEWLLKDGRPLSDSMQLLKFEELMLYLADRHPRQLFAFQPAPRSDISDLQLKNVVESNLTNNITVEEMAFLCNTSLSTFKRRFARLYDTSPNKWILQKRMELAASLLQDRHEKPSEVYYKVGYENHSSFTQSFKQVFGLTPSEFQQR